MSFGFFKGDKVKIIPSGGFEFANGAIQTSGSGSPEGVITAIISSMYIDTANGNLYTKISGSGNTGWELKIGTSGAGTKIGLNLSGIEQNGTGLPIVKAGALEVNGGDVNLSRYQLLATDVIGHAYQTMLPWRHYLLSANTAGVPVLSLAHGDLISSTAWSSVTVLTNLATVTHTAFGTAPVAGDIVIFEGTDFFGPMQIETVTDTTHFTCRTSKVDGTYTGGGTIYAHYPISTWQGSDDVTKLHYRPTTALASVYSPTPIVNTAKTGYYLNQYGRSVASATTFRAFGFTISGTGGNTVEVHSYGNGADKNDNIIVIGEGVNLSGSATYKYSTGAGTVTLYNYKFITPLKLWGDYTKYIITATDSYIEIMNNISADIDCSKLFSATGVNNNYIGINDRAYCGASCGSGVIGFVESNPMSHTEKLKIGDKIRILQGNNYAPSQATRESLSINMSRI